MKNEKEYLMLRDEITWRLKTIDTLATFTYTVYVSILGVALSTDIIELLLLPYVVIIPILLKVANHKYSIAYIAAYLNIFMEDNKKKDFKWEKLHVRYYEINERTLKEKIIYYGSSSEYAIMTILTTILFWIKYYSQSAIIFSVFQMHYYVFIQVIVILFVIYITISYMSFQKTKPVFINNWKKVGDVFLDK